MDRHRIADAELGEACKPTIHRTMIYAYRKLQKTPRADTAQAIIDALHARGITLTLKQLLAVPAKKRSKSRAA